MIMKQSQVEGLLARPQCDGPAATQGKESGTMRRPLLGSSRRRHCSAVRACAYEVHCLVCPRRGTRAKPRRSLADSRVARRISRQGRRS